MNENINLCEILKDCPKGTKLWSSVFGDCEFFSVNQFKNDFKTITVLVPGYYHFLYSVSFEEDTAEFNSKGGICDEMEECLLFPSKDQRDWSKWKGSKQMECPKPKFDPKTLKPFDKVLGGGINSIWKADFFSHERIPHEGSYKVFPYKCTGNMYEYCIPYNDDTKHLIGTSDEAPEYYRYWED